MLSGDQAAFLMGDVTVVLATRDADATTDIVRGFGVSISPDRTVVTIYVPTVSAAKSLENLRTDPRLAVVFACPVDYRTLQLKGRCTGQRPGTPDDEAVVERNRALLFDSMERVGLARSATTRWTALPCTAVELRVEEIFKQTPGPCAGERA